MNIFSAKLYLSSKRKDKIISAIQDPANAELVQQITSYLDEEFISRKYLDNNKSESNSEIKNRNSESDPDNIENKDDNSSKNSKHSFTPGFTSSGFDKMDDAFSGFDNHDGDDDSIPGDELDDSTEGEIEPVEFSSSTKLNEPVKSSLVLDVVKGTLNSIDDTSGVIRVSEQDDELWIYYEDAVNLNNVMSDAIQELVNRGYSMLEFSRLARSNNAIVFDIVKRSSGD